MKFHKSKLDFMRILLHSLPNIRSYKKEISSANVLVIFGGVIGDAILFLDSLKEMQLHYKNQGKEVTLLCNTAVAKFLKEIRRDINVKVISYDMDRIIESYRYFRSIVGQLNTGYRIVLVPMWSFKADILALNVKTTQKIVVRPNIEVKLSFRSCLSTLIYSSSILTPPDEMMFDSHKRLLESIGIKFYSSKIIEFNKQNSSCEFEKRVPYCVICPTARETEKCWEIQKFCQVIDHISETFNIEIYICAGEEGIGLFETINALVKHPSKLFDYSGKLSMSDWIEMIRNAQFCVGNDSASTHIAAHTGTMFFAITSGFHYGACLPYKIDMVSPGDALPVVINYPMPCFGCFAKRGRRSGGNYECKENVRKNGRYLCIENISTKEVIDAIDSVLMSQGIGG